MSGAWSGFSENDIERFEGSLKTTTQAEPRTTEVATEREKRKSDLDKLKAERVKKAQKHAATTPQKKPSKDNNPPSNGPSTPNGGRSYSLNLSRKDMDAFSEEDRNTFKKLIRKLIRNNSGVLSSPQKEAAQAKTDSKAQEELTKSASANDQKVKRKRKIITRKDKHGVIIEKIYKPFEGEQGEDIIVKYENGQPVGSFRRSELPTENGNHVSKYPKRKRKRIYDDSELDIKRPKSSLAATPDASTCSTERSDDGYANNVPFVREITFDQTPTRDMGAKLSPMTTEPVVPLDISHTLDNSTPFIPTTSNELAEKHDESPKEVPEISADLNHVEPANQLPPPRPKPPEVRQSSTAKFSAKTKVVAKVNETENLKSELDYFQGNVGAQSTSNDLMSYLMKLQNQDDYLDPYSCTAMIQRDMNLKEYRDEMSTSSESEKEMEQNNQESINSASANMEPCSSKSGIPTSKQESKPKSTLRSKSKKKKRKSRGKNFDSEDETAKNIINKISSRYKSDKEENVSIPMMKLSEVLADQGSDFKYEILNPGEDKTSRRLQIESVGLQNIKSNVLSATTCSLCGFQPSSRLGRLVGPYYSSSASDGSMGQDGSGDASAGKPDPDTAGVSDGRGHLMHLKCLEWCPSVTLVPNRLLNADEVLDIASKTVCSGCDSVGATIGCSWTHCKQAFHYPCIPHKDCDVDEELYTVQCKRHKANNIFNSAAAFSFASSEPLEDSGASDVTAAAPSCTTTHHPNIFSSSQTPSSSSF